MLDLTHVSMFLPPTNTYYGHWATTGLVFAVFVSFHGHGSIRGSPSGDFDVMVLVFKLHAS